MKPTHPDHPKWLLEERATQASRGRFWVVEDIDRQLRALGVDPPEDDPPKLPQRPPERADQSPLPERAVPAAPRRPDGFACSQCPRTFKTKAGLGSHTRSHR